MADIADVVRRFRAGDADHLGHPQTDEAERPAPRAAIDAAYLRSRSGGRRPADRTVVLPSTTIRRQRAWTSD